MEFRLGELFCGPGGLAAGAKNSRLLIRGKTHNIRHVWATDYDKDSCETFTANICPNNPKSVICKDIRKLNFDTLRKISTVDALAFGFPCNDFSIISKRKGIEGVFGELYKYCVNAVRYFRPKWFFAENVGGLRNSNDGNALGTILEKFADEGYRVFPHFYKFELYGVPQTRHRIIIVGIRDDQKVSYQVPSPPSFEKINISCKYVLNTPPIKIGAPNHDFTNQSPTVIERLKHIKPGENVFTAEMPERLRLNVIGAKISLIYRRLHPDRPSYTVTGSGGGGTHVYHWEENRALTNRERARLQTFPDNFIFHGSKESVRKQIGMAVPPTAAKVIFEAVLKTFAGKKYPVTSPNLFLQEFANVK